LSPPRIDGICIGIKIGGAIGRRIVVFPAFCKTDGFSPSEDSTNSNSTLFKLDPTPRIDTNILSLFNSGKN
jgi:hypothetical protein